MRTLTLILLLLSLVVLTASTLTEEELEQIVHQLPKVELHAHLHGSVRRSTLLELSNPTAENDLSTSIKLSLDNYDHGLPEKPFEIFPLVHAAVKNKEVVVRIVQEMIEDYRAQNCIYLEIRTTPRSLPDGTTMEEYLQLVVQTIAEYNKKTLDDNNEEQLEKMLVKLVISIDRSKKFVDAEEILSLVERYRYYEGQQVIVGVDFSGNPLGGRFQDFAPVFTEARKLNLNITVHTAELSSLSEEVAEDEVTASVDETSFILKFLPDRIGHLLHPKEKHFDRLLSLKTSNGKVPMVEICPTTAFFLLGLHSYADHPHVRRLLSWGYPLSLNTDDSGVFNTTLTQEILHIKYAINLSLEDIIFVLHQSVDYAFITEKERARLEKIFWKRVKGIVDSNPKLELDFSRLKGEDDVDMSHLYTM